MRALYAWLTILGSLVVGAVLGNVLVRSTGPVLTLAVACQVLSEAEKAGHLNAAKRADLIDRLVQSKELSANDKADAVKLKTECPKI
ncbi:MAG: hypothetical protein ACKVP7_24195 [Hyphomicrobiaceae bacterium]